MNLFFRGNPRAARMLLLVCLTLALAGCSSLPKDEAMIRHFHEHQQEFAELADLYLQYPSLARQNSTSDVSLSVPRERSEQLRDSLKIRSVRVSDYEIDFTVASAQPWFHVAPVGSYKGYVYRRRPLSPEAIYPNLDEYNDKWASNSSFYRLIEGDWYLYVEFTD